MKNTKILVMSMPESSDRRAFMDLKLRNSRIYEYEYFDAKPGSSMKHEYEAYEAWCAAKGMDTIRDGLPSYGCLMSYRSLFLQMNPGNYIVFEDDVYFHRRFFDILDSLPEDVMERYDILYLGHNNYEFSERHMDAIRSGDSLVPMQKDFMTYGTYGIMYGPRAVKLLKGAMANMSHEYVRPVDHLIWIHAVHHLRSAMINPPVVIPEVRTSAIREGRDMHEWCERRLVDMNDYLDVEKYPLYTSQNLGNFT